MGGELCSSKFAAQLLLLLLLVPLVAPSSVHIELSGAVSVTAGLYHTCASLTDGTARCWGYNNFGQLGDGSLTDRQSPVAVEGLHGVASISAGDYFTCARHSAGTVSCFGMNTAAQLGDGTTTTRRKPVAVTGLTGVTSLSCDAQHCCAATGGAAKCWGSNVYSQTGMPASSYQALPVAVPGLTDVVKVAAGGRHSCAALSSGAVACFGSNKAGQLGDGTTSDSQMPVTVNSQGRLLLLEPSLHTLTAGDYHTCAIWSDGSVSCWGSNLYGQLGSNSTVKFSTVPVQVPGVTDAVWINAGDYHTCVATKAGKALCWGLNFAGKLGDGTVDDALAPVEVLGLDNVATIAAGGDHTCATLAPGLVSCWGDNLYYQLGDGTTRRLPGKVQGISGARSVSADHKHTCAALDSGMAVCWGEGSHGELGDNSTDADVIPEPVLGLSDVRAVGTGDEHSCAALQSGLLYCWGDNARGQLGDGTTLERIAPVQVKGVDSVAVELEGHILSLGEAHTCAVVKGGRVLCFGANDQGQLGGGTNHDSLTPVEVVGVTDAISVTCGHFHTCILHATGAVSCVGANTFGELGDGTKITRSTVGPVLGIQNALSVSAGYLHTCAILESGEVSCWGDNHKGQLGLEVTDASNTDLQLQPSGVVAGLSDVKSISAGHAHTCAVLNSGDAKCWGDSEQAQLGNGLVSSSYQGAVAVQGLSNVRAITAGDFHTCAATDSDVYCWGSNELGQLGYIRIPGAISAEEKLYPYTECRQVIVPDGLNAFSQPCGKGSVAATFDRCQRVDLVVPASGPTAGVTCPDESCWMELVVQRKRGLWVQVADFCGSSRTSLSSCGTDQCSAEVPEFSCRQVTSLEPLTVRVAPCESAPAALATPLVRGEHVKITNTNSIQTSACRDQAKPGRQTIRSCWAEVTIVMSTLHSHATTVKGFLPISREVHSGSFSSAVGCNHTGPVEDLVDTCASEMHNVECRQATRPEGLQVFSNPCGTQVLQKIEGCHKFDFVMGSNTRKKCAGSADEHEWLMVRYVTSQDGLQEYGWIDAGASEIGDRVDNCPAEACAAVIKPGWECHQILTYPVTGVTLFKEPCFDQALRMSKEDIAPNSFWYYYGSSSKQTNKCKDKSSDNFCWVMGKMMLEGRLMQGWLPVAQTGKSSHFVDAKCDSSAGIEEFTRHHCDYCAGVTCPPPKECHQPRRCDPFTGKCDRGHMREPAGTPCSVPCTSSPTRRCPGACDNEGQCMPMASKPAQKALPSTVFARGANSAPCPSLQCLNGLDLASWKMGGTLGHFGSAKLASGLHVTDMLPISMLASLNQMFIGLDRQDSRARCAVPVKSGAELLRFKPNQASPGLAEALSTPSARLSADTVLANIADMYKACNNLPVPKGSELASQDYVWGVAGAMTNDAIARRVTRSYQWFNAADTGKQLGGMMLRQPGFAACAALNPCAGDFLYAFSGLEALIDLKNVQMSPLPSQFSLPLQLSIARKASLQQLALSLSGKLRRTVEAWDPFGALRTSSDAVEADAVSPISSYLVLGSFMAVTKSATELSIEGAVPTAQYMPEVTDQRQTTTVSIKAKYEGRLTIADASDGWTLLVEGSSAYPSVSLGGFFATPHTFDTAPKPMTMYVHQKSGPGMTIWLRHGARVRLASLLRSMPFGENMALLVDGYNQVPVETVNGFEVHYLAVEGGGMQAALLAQVPYSQGMGRLAAKVPKLANLPLGTSVWVQAMAEDNAHGDWSARVSVWGNYDGSFYGGEAALTCASVVLEYTEASAAAHSKYIPPMCVGVLASHEGSGV